MKQYHGIVVQGQTDSPNSNRSGGRALKKSGSKYEYADEELIKATVDGIHASRPLFVCCLGDRVEPKVPSKSLRLGAPDNKKWAWLKQIISSKHDTGGVSLTELEVLAAHLVPYMQNPGLTTTSFFYTRHPCLGSRTHPGHQSANSGLNSHIEVLSCAPTHSCMTSELSEHVHVCTYTFVQANISPCLRIQILRSTSTHPNIPFRSPPLRRLPS